MTSPNWNPLKIVASLPIMTFPFVRIVLTLLLPNAENSHSLWWSCLLALHGFPEVHHLHHCRPPKDVNPVSCAAHMGRYKIAKYRVASSAARNMSESNVGELPAYRNMGVICPKWTSTVILTQVALVHTQNDAACSPPAQILDLRPSSLQHVEHQQEVANEGTVVI